MAIVRTIIGALAIAMLPATIASASDPSLHFIGTKAPPAPSTAVPEPSDFALFAAGVAGLIIGRRSSRARKRRDD